MKRRWAITLCIISVLAAMIAASVIDDWYLRREQAARSAHDEDVANAGRDEAARTSANTEELAARDRDRNDKLLVAWGGPVEAAIKDPDYGIAQMLKALGQACAPFESEVIVHEDRFTEFEMEIKLPTGTSADVPELCLNVIRRGLPYLSGLRVFDRGAVAADFDDRLIGAIADWSSATTADVKGLLASATGPPPQEAEPSASTTPEDDGVENNPEQQALKRASEAYDSLMEDYNRRLTEAITCQSQAVNLREVQSEEDMDSKAKALQANQETLDDLKKRFLHSSDEFLRLLKQEKLNSMLVRILMRKPKGLEDQKAPYWQEIFSGLDERQNQCSAFVDKMTHTYGSWSVDSQTGTISFSSDDLRNAYESLTQNIKTATDRVAAAEANLAQVKTGGDSP